MPLILVFEFIAGVVVAGAVVASAVAAGAAVAPEPFVATGLALFVADAVAFAVATGLVEDDDEADSLDVAPGPVTGPPAMLIALDVPN